MRGVMSVYHNKYLRMRIMEKEMLHGDVAKLLGRGTSYFSARMCGKKPWDTDDIKRLAEILDIPPCEWLKYFFEGVA